MNESAGGQLAWLRDHWLFALVAVPFIIFAWGVYFAVQAIAPIVATNYLADQKEFKSAVKSYGVLDALLNRLLEQAHASRIGLYRFHNGSRDLYHTAFYFVTADYMVGQSPDLISVKDLPAATYGPAFPNLIMGLPWMAKHVDGLQWVCVKYCIDPLLSSHMLADGQPLKPGALTELEVKRGNKFVIYLPIRDTEDNLAGLMGIFWVDLSEVPQGQDFDAMLARLKKEADVVSGYFLWSTGTK